MRTHSPFPGYSCGCNFAWGPMLQSGTGQACQAITIGICASTLCVLGIFGRQGMKVIFNCSHFARSSQPVSVIVPLWVYVALFDQENANGQQFGRQAIETLASKDPSRKKIVAVWSTEKCLSEMSRTSQLEKMKPREWAKRHEVSQPAGHGGWLSRQRHQHGQAAGCMCVQQLAAEIASSLSGLQGSSSLCVFLSVVGCQLL